MSILRKRVSSRKTLKHEKAGSTAPRSTPIRNGAPIAARKLAERFGISIDHAIIVAHLAGLGDSEVR